MHRGECTPEERRERVTSPGRTLVDCLRTLPFDEALAVADSALRHGAFDRAGLVGPAEAVRGAGAARCRAVAAAADGRAANPFESVLRAIARDVPGLDLVPRVEIRARGLSVRPDLVRRTLRAVADLVA